MIIEREKRKLQEIHILRIEIKTLFDEIDR